MSESCCNTNTSNKASNQFDHKDAIQERYGSAALEKESCLVSMWQHGHPPFHGMTRTAPSNEGERKVAIATKSL